MYVSPYGNDDTGSGSQNAPFATPQRAADELYANYDLQCKYKAGIQLASANFLSQFESASLPPNLDNVRKDPPAPPGSHVQP
jgi:hypothetical protein